MPSLSRHDLCECHRVPALRGDLHRAIVVPVGLAIMLAIAVLYVLLQRYL